MRLFAVNLYLSLYISTYIYIERDIDIDIQWVNVRLHSIICIKNSEERFHLYGDTQGCALTSLSDLMWLFPLSTFYW